MPGGIRELLPAFLVRGCARVQHQYCSCVAELQRNETSAGSSARLVGAARLPSGDHSVDQATYDHTDKTEDRGGHHSGSYGVSTPYAKQLMGKPDFLVPGRGNDMLAGNSGDDGLQGDNYTDTGDPSSTAVTAVIAAQGAPAPTPRHAVSAVGIP